MARIYGHTVALTSVVVTLWYRSPEVLLHSTYSSSVDTWSLGCIFAELYLKHPLFIGNSDVDQLFKIFNILGLPSEQDWPINSVIPLDSFSSNNNLKKIQHGAMFKKLMPNMDMNAIDLLTKLLDFNIQKRITCKNALNHEYFKNDNFANQNDLDISKSCASLTLKSNMKETSINNDLASLPDISNIFQPNILKRKRFNQIN